MRHAYKKNLKQYRWKMPRVVKQIAPVLYGLGILGIVSLGIV